MHSPAPVAFVAALTLAAACTSTPARFYTLTAVAAPVTTTSRLSIAVGPVSIPSTVDRPQIVVNASANQLTLDDYHRWASPLQDNLVHVIAENLVALLGTSRVSLYPQPLSADVDYRVQVEIRNFESTPGKSAALDAVWTIRRSRDGKIESGRVSVREPLADANYDALAEAHSRAVAKLSRDIAEAVRAMQ
jgi:uncharacterized protein